MNVDATKEMKLTRSEILFNLAAIVSLIASITIWFLGDANTAIFIGLWVPSILAWMNFASIKENRRALRRGFEND